MYFDSTMCGLQFSSMMTSPCGIILSADLFTWRQNQSLKVCTTIIFGIGILWPIDKPTGNADI